MKHIRSFAALGAASLLCMAVPFATAEDAKKSTDAAPVATKKEVRAALPPTLSFELGQGVELKLARIPAGNFVMGSPVTEANRKANENQHPVHITFDYMMGIYEVTQEQYEAILGKANNPSYFHDSPKQPVEQITWNDARAFCDALNTRLAKKLPSGYEFDLPTEAQWEYACRAGSTTVFNFGNQLNGFQANCYGQKPYGTDFKGNYIGKTVDAGSYQPNAWGLYDMHGNVAEWCRDNSKVHEGVMTAYPFESNKTVTNPSILDGKWYIYRGGAWNDYPVSCRSAARYGNSANISGSFCGMRLALVPKKNSVAAQTTK